MRASSDLDFDVDAFLHNLKATKPPYECPVPRCGRIYKSFSGIQTHLESFDHSVAVTPKSARKKNKSRLGQDERSPSPQSADVIRPPREPKITYIDADKTLEYETDAFSLKFHIADRIPFVLAEESAIRSETSSQSNQPAAGDGNGADKVDCGAVEEKRVKLPEACFKEVDYDLPDAPPLPNNYIRFIERSSEELDEGVEYDMDEEDAAWLEIMNEQRRVRGLTPVKEVHLELLMDRLEKESFFQAQTTMGTNVLPTDEEAVCCVCLDGECENSNVILFCDMCNLAVHQECYGVPYIPEGQWWCRRCLQSPSRAVDCVLCPNRGGAFKQTDDGRWAHVVCALWVPEVCFANTVFLEPIDSINRIPAARWKLSCYICKQRNVGACIQCHKANCYTAFHVTCAQQAGMHIKIDAVRDSSSAAFTVRKAAFCDVHTPVDSDAKPALDEGAVDSTRKAQAKVDSRQKMRKARKLLAERRTAVPIVSVPTIPPERVQQLATLIDYPRKNHFIQRLLAFWTLKRHARNGVPLLRRLQVSNKHVPRRSLDSSATAAPFLPTGAAGAHPHTDQSGFREQLKDWQRLRQDLEKVRLLCELVRKREKTKRELIKCMQAETRLRLCPLQPFLKEILDQLFAKDQAEIFTQPVDTEEVEDYLTVVHQPMDLSTMRQKLETLQYWSLASFTSDFDLMVHNCLVYNDKDTMFYKAGVRMRQLGGAMLRKARADLEQMGLASLCSSTNQTEKARIKTDEEIIQEVSCFLDKQQESADDEQLTQLTQLLSKVETLTHGGSRAKWTRQIRAEMTKVRRKKSLSLSERKTKSKSTNEDDTVSETSDVEMESVLTDAEHQPSIHPGTSAVSNPQQPSDSSSTAPPTGVNRRTAVLFNKKNSPSPQKRQIRRRNRSTSVTLSFSSFGDSASEAVQWSAPNNYTSSTDNAAMGTDSAGVSTGAARNADRDGSFTEYRQTRASGVCGSDDDEDGDSRHRTSTSTHRSAPGIDSDCSEEAVGTEARADDTESLGGSDCGLIALEPLDLIWAKCRGHPWYPALIIDPRMPRTGYFHNGVPIPVPPQEVLDLAESSTQLMYLILFFDAKRTWQWLPRDKLEPLGIDQLVDQAKLTAARRPADRRAVRVAYDKAVHHQCRVSGKTAAALGLQLDNSMV